ncbi:3_t:CDS:2, partial [Paraglomus occultum]
MRLVEYANEPLRALWISYDRSLDAGPNENDKVRPTIANSKKGDEAKTEEAMQTEETAKNRTVVTRAKLLMITRAYASWERRLWDAYNAKE